MPNDSPSLDTLRQACVDPLPHPSLEQVQAFSAQVTDFLLRDFAALPQRGVGAFAGRAEMERRLREPAPEEGKEFAHVLAEFQEHIAPHVVRTSHPRFLAFVPGAPSFLSILGDWLCAGLNYFAGVWKEAAGPTQVEIVVLDWFRDFLGMPASARGVLTSGGSEANLLGLVVARSRLDQADRARAILYVSAQRHWSVDRAAMVMGWLPHQVRALPVGPDQRLQRSTLLEAVAEDRRKGRLPWALVANAGATNTGAVDCLDELAAVCRAHDLWFHVDAAYGWPAVLTPTEKDRLRGIEQADSITLDPHKWFAQTFEAGCLLVRDGAALENTFRLRPEYMQDVAPQSDEINFADHGIALTRRFRALKIWLSMKTLGVGWFRRLVEHCCLLAELTQRLLEAAGSFEILCPRNLSIVCFRYRPAGMHESDLNDLNRRLLEDVCRAGQFFLSSTDLAGRFALRVCFVNWRTTAADVEMLVRHFQECGSRLYEAAPAAPA